MPYLRISFMKPQRGNVQEVEQLNGQLVEYYRQQKGCLECYLIAAADQSGEIGRVSLWESKAAADRVAQTDRSLAMRSRLHLLIEAGHSERLFVTR